jgi:hypothetical protein
MPNAESVELPNAKSATANWPLPTGNRQPATGNRQLATGNEHRW